MGADEMDRIGEVWCGMVWYGTVWSRCLKRDGDSSAHDLVRNTTHGDAQASKQSMATVRPLFVCTPPSTHSSGRRSALVHPLPLLAPLRLVAGRGSLVAGRLPPRAPMSVLRPPSVQEEAGFSILYHPLKPLLQVQPTHSAAAQNGPLVCLDGVESEALYAVSNHWPANARLNSSQQEEQSPPRAHRPRSWRREHRFCS